MLLAVDLLIEQLKRNTRSRQLGQRCSSWMQPWKRTTGVVRTVLPARTAWLCVFATRRASAVWVEVFPCHACTSLLPGDSKGHADSRQIALMRRKTPGQPGAAQARVQVR